MNKAFEANLKKDKEFQKLANMIRAKTMIDSVHQKTIKQDSSKTITKKETSMKKAQSAKSLNQEKEVAAQKILDLKKQMEALDKEYDKAEKFLMAHMTWGESIVTPIGKVDFSTTTRRFVDSGSLFKMMPLDNFIECVSVKVGKAEDFLGSEELSQISETKEYDKLNVVLKKEPVKVTKGLTNEWGVK